VLTTDELTAYSVDTRLEVLWGSTALVLALSKDESAYIDVGDQAFQKELFFGKVSTGGNYAFEIDWSNDGIVTMITQAIGLGDNWPMQQPVVAKYARFRIRNTDPINPFTLNRTFVTAR